MTQKGSSLKSIRKYWGTLKNACFHGIKPLPSLRIHALQGNLKGLHSISITLSYGLTIEFLIDGKEIIPIDIGTHDQV